MISTKIHSLFYSIIFIILLNIVGCQKQEIQEMDDTRYIVDLQMILILCEEPETGTEYTNAIRGLKGNGDEILESISQLEVLEQTVAVKNAIGVGKNLLRKPNEAEIYFQEALLEAENSTDRAILLSNLAEAKYYQKEYVKQYDMAISFINEAVEEYEKVNTDVILRMVLESNQVRLNMMKDSTESAARYSFRLKKLLKEERKQFGSNQFIGMFNFQSMGLMCHYDRVGMKRSLAYMEDALNINQKLYQYTFFDINMYHIIAAIYSRDSNYEKKMEYRDKCIELTEKWQSKWHYSRLQAYVKRAEGYYWEGELEKSSEDYQVVLKDSTEDTDLVALSYYYLGQIYDMQKKKSNDFVLDYYFRAFCIWEGYDRPDGLQSIQTSIENHYRYYGYEKENPDFESWFTENNEKTRKEMVSPKRGKENKDEK